MPHCSARLCSSLTALVRRVGRGLGRAAALSIATVAMFALLTGLDMAGQLQASITTAQSVPTSLIPQGGYKINSVCDQRPLAERFATGEFELYDLPCYATYLTELLIYLAGAVAVLFIVIGGYQYIIGSISDDKESGKKTISYALGGLAITIVAWTVVNAWQVFVTSGDYKATEKYEPASGAVAVQQAAVLPGGPVQLAAGALNTQCPAGTPSAGQNIDIGQLYTATNEGVVLGSYNLVVTKKDGTTETQITTGIGHHEKGNAYQAGTPLSFSQVYQLFQTDYAKHQQEAQRIARDYGVDVGKLDTVRQIILTDMAFQLGGGSVSKKTGLGGYPNMFAAIKQAVGGDATAWQRAAAEIQIIGAGSTRTSPHKTFMASGDAPSFLEFVVRNQNGASKKKVALVASAVQTKATNTSILDAFCGVQPK